MGPSTLAGGCHPRGQRPTRADTEAIALQGRIRRGCSHVEITSRKKKKAPLGHPFDRTSPAIPNFLILNFLILRAAQPCAGVVDRRPQRPRPWSAFGRLTFAAFVVRPFLGAAEPASAAAPPPPPPPPPQPPPTPLPLGPSPRRWCLGSLAFGNPNSLRSVRPAASSRRCRLCGSPVRIRPRISRPARPRRSASRLLSNSYC